MKFAFYTLIIFSLFNSCALSKKKTTKYKEAEKERAHINTGEEKIGENFDFGKIEDGLYTNNFFKLKIPFNPSWIVQDKQQMNDLVETGSDLFAGDDKTLKSAIKSAKVNTAYLFTIFKHEVGAAVEFNPSFMVIAENTKSLPGLKNGSDYLFHAKKFLEQSQMKYLFEKDVFEKKIGNSDFHVLEAKLDQMGTLIIQEYIATVTKGFSLSFVVTYSNEDERNELYKIVDKIKFN